MTIERRTDDMAQQAKLKQLEKSEEKNGSATTQNKHQASKRKTEKESHNYTFYTPTLKSTHTCIPRLVLI